MAMESSTSGPSRKLLSEINVTPFVDVMLVLLIIFMVTAPLLTEGIRLELPKAEGKALDDDPGQRVIVSIQKDGSLFIGKNEFTEQSEFFTKVKAIYENRPDKDIYIRADKEVPYGVVIGIISEIQRIGITHVGMITEPGRPETGK